MSYLRFWPKADGSTKQTNQRVRTCGHDRNKESCYLRVAHVRSRRKAVKSLCGRLLSADRARARSGTGCGASLFGHLGHVLQSFKDPILITRVVYRGKTAPQAPQSASSRVQVIFSVYLIIRSTFSGTVTSLLADSNVFTSASPKFCFLRASGMPPRSVVRLINEEAESTDSRH